jgi:hypothetical protein
VQHLAKQKVNANYNSYGSENELITTAAAEIWQIDKVVNATTGLI